MRTTMVVHHHHTNTHSFNGVSVCGKITLCPKLLAVWRLLLVPAQLVGKWLADRDVIFAPLAVRLTHTHTDEEGGGIMRAR